MNPSRDQQIADLSNIKWDLVIIGGGITGAGIMREAVRQNLKTLLIEQKDFAWGTSSRSGQLVHGGLRYLGQGNIRLTYESVKERERLLKQLPGLVEPQKMMMAIYKKKWLNRLIVRTALFIYDLMSRNFRKHTYPLSEIIQQAPDIKSDLISCGLLFYESLTDDARLVYRILQEAMYEGGVALNYCKATKLLKRNGVVSGIQMQDLEEEKEYEVTATQVINATGVWVDGFRETLNKANSHRMRPLRGSHLVFSQERLPVSNAIVITHPVSKRPGFVEPWEGRVLVGNTDIDHKDNLDSESYATADEVDYLMENLHHHFPSLKLQKSDIISTFAGVRPVIDSGKEDPSSESREHAVWLEDGLLTVTGGKLTTFRLLALDVLNKAQTSLGPLPDLYKEQPFFNQSDIAKPSDLELNTDQWKRLQGRFGNQLSEFLKTARQDELVEIPGIQTLWAELRWAAANENVIHLEDLMYRRTRIGLLLKNGGELYLPRIKEICQSELGWDDIKWDAEKDAYLRSWHMYHCDLNI